MSRRSRLASRPLDRRTLLAAAGATGLTAGLGTFLGRGGDPARATSAAPHRTAAPAASAAPAPSPAGTTLESVATAYGSGGYLRLGDGPGWERVVREDLALAGRDREDRRTVLASFVQLTDVHVTDVQHPLRFEHLRAGTTRAWRPQEALAVHGAVSMVERVNSLTAGPATGVPPAFVMTTGDNTDNNCHAELDWFLTAMSGGRITPNTGDPRRYEGVQDSGLPLYWHPDSGLEDLDKQYGFPRIDGFLAAATGRVVSPGLTIPWYSTAGNHDTLLGGHFTADSYFADFAVGERKLFTLSATDAAALRRSIREGRDTRGEHLKQLLSAYEADMRPVTPDPARAPFTRREYLEAHLDPAYTGPGPAGHGYTRANLEEDRLYYSFRVAEGVVGISLDTTNPDGDYRGHIGASQLRWLERELVRHRDAHVLVFSHHYCDSITVGGPELLAVLERHGNVAAWFNGHSHRNRITPRGGFWEVTTASHVDYPQLARAIELVDNRDGTLSLFTTCIESAAPHSTDFDDLSPSGLASLYRELALNAPERSDDLAGAPGDRNTELVLPRA